MIWSSLNKSSDWSLYFLFFIGDIRKTKKEIQNNIIPLVTILREKKNTFLD
jgi:hypothetical protein